MMQKLIDVIIIAYNGHKYIKNALESIEGQTVKDIINVIIVNDHSDHDYSEEISLYNDKLDIKEVKLHCCHGAGVAREKGIKSSQSKYLIFLDCDDTFYDNKSIENLFNKMEENSNLVMTEGKVLKDKETICSELYMHGKIYKRDFIKQKGIKSINLYVHEDLCFNLCVIFLSNSKNIAKIDNIIYKYNTDVSTSITHVKKDAIKMIDSYIKAYEYALTLAKKNRNTTIAYKYSFNVFKKLGTLYYNYNKDNIFKNEEEKIYYRKLSYKFYYKYQKYIEACLKCDEHQQFLKLFIFEIKNS